MTLCGIHDLTSFQEFAGISCADCPWMCILSDDRVGSDHCSATHGDSWCDESPGRDPTFGSDLYRVEDEGEVRVAVVMAASAEMCMLGNDGHRVNRNFSKVQNLDIVCDHYVVFHHQIQGINISTRCCMRQDDQFLRPSHARLQCVDLNVFQG